CIHFSCLYLSNFLSLSVFQLQTFQVPSCVSKHELTSGVAIAHVLNKIDSSWFNETWLSRIKEDGGTNWRLKVSNLKKILQSMMEYYHDVLGQQVSDEHVPDVCLIGEMGDVTELGRLLQLVLGCAVSCDQKQEHIQQIMTLEEQVQHVVMTAIQEVHNTQRSTLRCLCVIQVSVLMEEKSSLQVELQSLRERLNRCETPDVSSTITNKKLLLLQSQMEQLQEENYRLDSSRDDLRVRADVLEREVTDLQLRNEELTSLAQEAQSLKDEMDILRHSSDRVSRLEAMVETYKRKLEDLGDLRRQVRLLEERNHVYMQRTCELEEELRRANAIRSQLDTYKRQVKERCLHCSRQHTSLHRQCEDTVVRLQQENKTLCVQEESYRHRLEELQTQLEDSQRSQNTLETQNRLSQQQISELSAQVEELQRALQEQDSKTEDSSLLKKKLEEHLEKLHEAHSDLQRKREVIDDLEPHKIDELQEILKKKDEDMRRMEDRYKRYVEKARTVIKTLDPKQKSSAVPAEVQVLKNQLTEKDRKIQHLEVRHTHTQTDSDFVELHLCLSVCQGMALHQKVAGERSGPSSAPAQSFLAQQRQWTQARRGLSRLQPR
uniref:Protein Hook homolog 2-like n=1 Tax=Sinocyclocheilus anshuiensis TaxID=1608454 RepID=A0A671Q1L7_9TELE